MSRCVWQAFVSGAAVCFKDVARDLSLDEALEPLVLRLGRVVDRPEVGSSLHVAMPLGSC